MKELSGRVIGSLALKPTRTKADPCGELLQNTWKLNQGI